MKVVFTASRESMATIEPVTIALPQGPQGEKGNTGPAGKDGQDGYTPVKGTDYWTDADIADIKSYVDKAILGGAW